jgi:hypothetical protein
VGAVCAEGVSLSSRLALPVLPQMDYPNEKITERLKMNDTQLGLIAAAKQSHLLAGEQEWIELKALLDQACPVPDGFVPCEFSGHWEYWSDDKLVRSLTAKVPGASYVNIVVTQNERGELEDWTFEGEGEFETYAQPARAQFLARDLLLAVDHAKRLGYTESGGTA